VAPAQQGECAADWELDGQLCYPPCPDGFAGAGPVCRTICPADSVDEGTTCRSAGGVVEKETRARSGTQLTRSQYRDLFVKFVQIYRAAAAFVASPLTEAEKTYLLQFFPARLVDGVRVAVVPALELPFVMDVKAMTIGSDLIVVKGGQRSDWVLKHELVHVCQADRVGDDEFIRNYADEYVDSGYDYSKIALEKEAYGFNDVTGQVSAYLGYCQ
jgi:hypothetical protein